jgi:hypothetical protein
MIHELVKRDVAWRMTPIVALVAMASVEGAGQSKDPLGVSLIFAVAVYLCSLAAAGAYQRATLFESALPIDGRDLYLARAISLLAMIWAPVPAVCAAVVLSGGQGSVVLTWSAFAGIATLWAMVLLSMSIERLDAEGYLPAFIIAFLVIAIVLAGIVSEYIVRIWAAIVWVGVLGSMARFFIVRSSVPKAFQVVPVEAVASRARFSWPVMAKWPTGWAALPLLPSLGLPYLGFLYFGFSAGWTWCILAVSMTKSMFRLMRWLDPFPVSRRTLLLLTVVPPILATIAGHVVGRASLTVLSPRMLVLRLAFSAGVLLAAALFFSLPDWRRVRQFPRPVQISLKTLGFVGLVALLPLAMRSPSMKDQMAWLAAVPGSLPLLIGIVLPALAALYWATDKVFREGEWL